jgi:hypothetical protein
MVEIITSTQQTIGDGAKIHYEAIKWKKETDKHELHQQ